MAKKEKIDVSKVVRMSEAMAEIDPELNPSIRQQQALAVLQKRGIEHIFTGKYDTFVIVRK